MGFSELVSLFLSFIIEKRRIKGISNLCVSKNKYDAGISHKTGNDINRSIKKPLLFLASICFVETIFNDNQKSNIK